MRSFLHVVCAALAVILMQGCVSVRGPIEATLLDPATGKAIPDIEVYHYVTRHTIWPFQDTGETRIARMKGMRTDEYGSFRVPRYVTLLFPFAQKVESERLIVNLDLRQDLKEKSVEDATFLEYWTTPSAVRAPNPNYLGYVIDFRNALFGANHPLPPAPETGSQDIFYRATTDDRSIGQLPLPRSPNAPSPSIEAPISPSSTKIGVVPMPNLPALDPELAGQRNGSNMSNKLDLEPTAAPPASEAWRAQVRTN